MNEATDFIHTAVINFEPSYLALMEAVRGWMADGYGHLPPTVEMTEDGPVSRIWIDGVRLEAPYEHPLPPKCGHKPGIGCDEAIGWASSPAANTVDQLEKLIKLALASVNHAEPDAACTGLVGHVDPALLES